MLPYIFLFILGIILGSFYNVVATRIPNGESIIKPGSHCTNCYHLLKWYELIPLVSYIIQRGRCRKCYKKLSIWYFLSELFTGLSFAFSYYLYGFDLMTIKSCILVSIVMITIISDVSYMVILDSPIIIGTILLMIVDYFIGGFNLVLVNTFHGLMMFLIVLVIKILGDKVFKQESLGWGDVKFSYLAGYILNIPISLIYLFLGAFIALPNATYQSIKKGTSITPFGPFLALSLMILFWLNKYVVIIIKLWLKL